MKKIYFPRLLEARTDSADAIFDHYTFTLAGFNIELASQGGHLLLHLERVHSDVLAQATLDAVRLRPNLAIRQSNTICGMIIFCGHFQSV